MHRLVGTAKMGTVAGATPSPLERAVARVGDRWSLLVVSALLDGPRRFGQLQEALGGIAPNVLSARLKHLEREGVLVAQAYSVRPPRFAYQLTGAGHDLAGALRLLARWGAAAGDEPDDALHGACGTPLEATWWCPTCERPVDAPADEGDDVTFA